ncbi:LuxR C-terminal-related transcriptional regulator [Pseudonocardia sp. GCM10023141]|uniref:helix-turn-helix transcriptional regulator n=1 Tax=Pseudonocardia sp. GCM10023141 TaxID=3252653 RepID=UPI003614732D
MEARLTLSYMDDVVVLDVRDDGIGFERSRDVAMPAGTGFGLAAMERRVRRISGTFAVESAPGDGTALSASVPARPAEHQYREGNGHDNDPDRGRDRRRSPDRPLAVVAARTGAASGAVGVDVVLMGLRMPTMGGVLKDSPRDELLRAIRAVHRGEAVLSPAVADRLMGQVRIPLAGALSAREPEVLTIVADGCTNRDVARRLFISEATVKTHLLHIFTKLEVRDRATAVAAGYQRGLFAIGG